jgi:MFS family permease
MSDFYPWYVVLVLCLAQLVSIVDRIIMGVAAEPVRHDLNLSDSQLGILLGPSFVLLNVVGGLFAGRLADLTNRRWLIFFGIIVWNVANACCGLARNFEQLLTARLVVGLGEAILTPAAMSLIASYFPPKNLYRATSIFLSGTSLGRAAAFLGGGAIIATLALPGPDRILSSFAPWQVVFLAASAFGALVAILVLSIREPVRIERSDSPSKASAAFAHFRANKRAYLALFFSFTCTAVVTYVLGGWTVSFFVREHGLSVGAASAWVGTNSLIVGPASTIFGGLVTDYLHAKHVRSPGLRVIICCLILFPFSALGFWLASSFAAAFIFYVLMYFMVGVTIAPSFGGIQAITPEPYRGTITSLFVATYTTLGAGVGPYIVGVLADKVFASDRMLGPSIFIAVTGSAIIGLIAAFSGLGQTFQKSAEGSAVLGGYGSAN